MFPPYRTYPEYLTQSLFRIAVDVAFQRAHGVCEICHNARATEPHHLKYPAWGAFDTPSNILAVCHACHSKEHGKGNANGHDQ